MKPMIHFAHGNGFPSPCYHQMLTRLSSQFDVCYIDRIGHSIDYPVTENWHKLVEELIHSVKSNASEPVIAVGHSLGGVLSFRAAIEQPELFQAVVMLDSPIIGRFKSRLLRLSKTLGMIDHMTPAFRTRGRRHFWKTKEDAFNYLRSRELFKHFTDACLEDYIQYGMNKSDKGYSLRFDKTIEYQIYRTIPHMLYQYEGRLTVPCALIYGSKSNVVDGLDLRNMKKNYNVTCYEISGTHMFPMEHPQLTAELIVRAIDELI
ncbi:alpha/beta fold hydrolase [Legionella impletisoli]|uniref:Alpha/beta hydrolase n=1 Tax=Legionella impletisoli TaxID=343510 RepID=A0A917N8B1_9GAMM|nr:alpha/beta hydrolase [Legionella impletisoli]GGI75654.1 alpha/beta hydrolase [Legionella impletisoli]